MVRVLGRYEVRMAAMEDFLSDYSAGKKEGRHVDAELPALPFADLSFDLALSAHFLFLYSSQLAEECHRAAVLEMGRVAKECRIFPLLDERILTCSLDALLEFEGKEVDWASGRHRRRFSGRR